MKSRKLQVCNLMQIDGEHVSEAEALRLAQQGDSDAFEYLYRRHNQRVYSLCLRMVKNHAQAEDLTQDTFIAVLRGIRHFRGQSAFPTWLHRVTRNTVLMCFRKRRLKETSLDEIVGREVDGSSVAAEFGMPDRRLENIADRMLLQHAIAQLSQGFRAALLLHDVHGYEHSEVAAVLGCATGTSKSQVHKARLRVRQLLKKWLRSHRRAPARINSEPLADANSGKA
jgi:RNA polymerase sigma-70 factor, ECF subfamily